MLDRFARERREEGAGGGARSAIRTAPRAVPRFSAGATGSSPAGRSRWRWPALSHSWWRSRWYSRVGTTRAGAAYARVSLDPRAGGSASATAWLGEVPAGTRIRLESSGLPAGSEYEVWCIRSDGRWVSGGTFWADRDGRADAELTAAVRPGDYHRMVVTRRPAGAEEGARGPAVLGGALRY